MNRPPNTPPAMPFGPNGGPEAWGSQNFRPNPERPAPLDRTIGGVMGQEMGMRLRQALASNQVTKPMMDQWSREPWKAYPFLSNTIRTNDPMMAALSRWYLAASVGRNAEEQRQLAARWAQTEPEAANALQGLVGSVQGGLKSSLETQLATRQELNKMRLPQSANALEGFGSKFADYMRDWREHPLTATGVVLGAFLIYKTIKGKNIGMLLGMGAVGVALYSFLRDQYGIEPFESIARATDKWGLPTASKILRKTVDTIRRPFEPSDIAGSAFSYVGDKLSVNGDDEKRMLAAIWDMKPGDFLAAHQAVLNQKLSAPNKRVTLPPAVQQVLRQMGADQTFARRWANTPENERADLFLAVANKVLQSMPGGMRMGAKHISDRFVTGAFFQQSYARQGGRIAATQSSSPVEAQISSDMAYAVQHSDMKMGDVITSTIMTPEDWKNIEGYKHGYAATQIVGGLQEAGGKVWGWTTQVAGQGWDIVRNDIPAFWNYNVWPMLQRNGFTRENATGIIDQAGIALGQARNSAIGLKDFMIGSTLFRVTKEGVLYVWEPATEHWNTMWTNLDQWIAGREQIRADGGVPVGPGTPVSRPTDDSPVPRPGMGSGLQPPVGRGKVEPVARPGVVEDAKKDSGTDASPDVTSAPAPRKIEPKKGPSEPGPVIPPD